MKNKTLSENVQDLPKWAQTEIRTLIMRLKEKTSELLRIKENQASNTIVGSKYIMKDETPQYLKENQMVTFMINETGISAQLKHNYLEIRADSFNEGDLYIRPEVSNTIQIHIK